MVCFMVFFEHDIINFSQTNDNASPITWNLCSFEHYSSYNAPYITFTLKPQ